MDDDDDDRFHTSLYFAAISSYSTVLPNTTGNLARKIAEILPNEPPSTMEHGTLPFGTLPLSSFRVVAVWQRSTALHR